MPIGHTTVRMVCVDGPGGSTWKVPHVSPISDAVSVSCVNCAASLLEQVIATDAQRQKP
jgi:hypothetical protein